MGHYVGLLFLYGALDSHPFFPSHGVSGHCILTAAAAGVPAGVVSAFAERRRWCAGAVLVASGAVYTLVVPSSWGTGVVLVAGGRLTVFAAPPLPHKGPMHSIF